MTGRKGIFTELRLQEGGSITFGGGKQGKVQGIGTIQLNENIFITNVSWVTNLKYNLLSVSQLCDNGKNSVTFTTSDVKVTSLKNNEVFIRGRRDRNIYKADQKFAPSKSICLSVMQEDTRLWHQRLGHANLKLISKLQTKDLVVGLPKINAKDGVVCEDCVMGKQTRVSFKTKKTISTSRPLELLHIDLCGPMRTRSLNHSRYVLVIVDDFSRFTWTEFLQSKEDTFEQFEALMKRTQRKLGQQLVSIRSDHGTEFENSQFLGFCTENGISHNFSTPRTPQQNGVVERKNRTLEEMTRTMLLSSSLPQRFWGRSAEHSLLYIESSHAKAWFRENSV